MKNTDMAFLNNAECQQSVSEKPKILKIIFLGLRYINNIQVEGQKKR